MKDWKRRLTDKPTLIAVAAYLYTILEMTNVTDWLPQDFWSIVVLGGINVLVILGFVNNPTTKEKKWYGDDKSQK